MRGVIIAFAILVLCAAVSYSFEDLTGFFPLVNEDETTVVITSSISPIDSAKCKEFEMACVKAGESITLFITPSSYGAKRYFTIHKYPSNLRKGIKNWCSLAQGICLSSEEECTPSFKCYGITSINYKTSKLWSSGIYYIRLYDYTLTDYVTEPFEVV